MQKSACRVVPFPKRRTVIVDAVRMASKRNTIHGLVEADVTRARRLLAERKLRGDEISFSAFVGSCLVEAIKQDKMLQAYKDWRGNLVVFDDIDLNILTECTFEGTLMPMSNIIRSADSKSLAQINDEVLSVKRAQWKSTWGKVIKFSEMSKIVRAIYWFLIGRTPQLMKDTRGTVQISAVGMYGKGFGGYGIPIPDHTLSITLGGIATKPVLCDGKLENHDFLNITVSVDHDVVDGAPAARFAKEFVMLLESGYGLNEEEQDAAQPVSAAG